MTVKVTVRSFLCSFLGTFPIRYVSYCIMMYVPSATTEIVHVEGRILNPLRGRALTNPKNEGRTRVLNTHKVLGTSSTPPPRAAVHTHHRTPPKP